MTVAVIVIVGALVVGLLLNAFVNPRVVAVTDRRGLDAFFVYSTTAGLIAPAVTLLALFVSFTVANAAQSYARAKTAVQIEAEVVDNFFETAQYADDPFRRRLQRSAVCYARAVAGPEWEIMRRGTGEESAVPSNWIGTGPHGIRRTFLALGPEASLFATLTAADQKRADARRNRLSESQPTVPAIVTLFIIAIGGLIIAFHLAASPHRSVVHWVAVGISAATLIAAIFLIYSLDRPFRGPLAISATDMRATADDITEDFAAGYGAGQLRCDARGNAMPSR